MAQVLLDEIVHTDHGQFEITWGDGAGFDGDFSRAFRGQVNGLVGAADPDFVHVNLARRSGGSPVVIELHDDRPPDDASYQDVVEVSVDVPPEADVDWASWAGASGGALLLPDGQYRLRVSARDRDVGAAQEHAADAVDAYLLQLWPEAVRGDEIVRVGSRNAAYWHKTIAERVNGGRSR